MNSTTLPPKRPSGYLLDGTPMYDLREIAATAGLTYADCEEAFYAFICSEGIHRVEGAAIQAGVMRADDPRFHPVQ